MIDTVECRTQMQQLNVGDFLIVSNSWLLTRQSYVRAKDGYL